MVAEPFSADQAERHDEMADYMQKVGAQPSELSVERRNPRSVADKNAVGGRRTVWRVITSMEPKGFHYKTKIIEGGCAAQAPEWKDCDELIPKWLNRIVGTVDSEDHPLDISGETLLQNKIMRVIKKNQVKKYLEILAEIAELNAAYEKFHEQFGARLKLGISEDFTVGVKTAELLMFNTSGDEQICLREHVDRMKEGQNDIWHITGESIAVVSSSPFEENLRNKGYEVLYTFDPVDEDAVHQPKEFGGKMLNPTLKEGLNILLTMTRRKRWKRR